MVIFNVRIQEKRSVSLSERKELVMVQIRLVRIRNGIRKSI